jgi:hypothetical protein
MKAIQETVACAASHGQVDWHAIDWRKGNQNVRRLQARIVKATREGGRYLMWNRVPQGALQRLEPDEAKVSRPVLRGGGGGNTASLPDHLKGQDTGEHLQKIGELMQHLLIELHPNYVQEPVYQVLERVFSEHFRVEEKVLKTKVGKELSASSLQSPDDLEGVS